MPLVAHGMTIMQQRQDRDTKQGFILAGGAYFLWGFLPFYLKALSHVPALEVVPHRVLWSLPICAGVTWYMGQMGDVLSIMRDWRKLAYVFAAAGLITINWLIYVWAIGNGHALESALGYYINPLFSVFLASVLLGEKLSRVQWIAVALVCAAVSILSWEVGGLPWVSIGLVLSWGCYAYLKKTLPIQAITGFFLEIVVLSIPALIALIWFESRGTGHFLNGSWTDVALLGSAGLVTAIPLMLYAAGAKLLRLSTIAMMQYSAPTMIFLIAVFVFNEPFSMAKGAAFILIWTALAVYTWSVLRKGAAL
jgi:chloramphenicol-sensitive protein RarD